jgi:hypothetical protein
MSKNHGGIERGEALMSSTMVESEEEVVSNPKKEGERLK